MNYSPHEPFELSFGEDVRLLVWNFADYLLIRNRAGSKHDLAQLGRRLYDRDFAFVDEVIVAESEICLALNEAPDDRLLDALASVEAGDPGDVATRSHRLSIWFPDDIKDWEIITGQTGWQPEAYIERLLQCEFRVAMIGFLPGFVYLDGLPQELQVLRRYDPAVRTLPNTFAVGGKYAGIYSLPSAAGWHSVGRVAEAILRTDRLPPLAVGQGDSVTLQQIDEATFHEIRSRDASNEREVLPAADNAGSLKIEKPGTLALIQDRGRAGLAYFAIPRGGAMDSRSCDLANAVLSNSSDAPVIECHFSPPSILFETDATICLTGADMNWLVDQLPVRRNSTLAIEAGQRLTGSPARDGCRAYIGISGAIQTETTFGSASCHLHGKFGGNAGRRLAAGDRVVWAQPATAAFPLRIDLEHGREDDTPLPFNPGPEFGQLDAQSQRLLFSTPFSPSIHSDRAGAKLDGPTLCSQSPSLVHSVPVLPGMIQLTMRGQLIVILQDGGTTGGYPRIGYLDREAVHRLCQTPIGHPFFFEMAD